MRVGAVRVDETDVREHEGPHDVARGQRLGRGAQGVERDASARREIARPPGDDRARAELLVDFVVAGLEGDC